jgi:DNA-binding Lrp family transcriptional regulator
MALDTEDPGSIHTLVRVRLADRTRPEMFEIRLCESTAVQEAWAVAGDYDYEVRLRCPGMADLRRELHALRVCGAEHTDTCFLLRAIVTAA